MSVHRSRMLTVAAAAALVAVLAACGQEQPTASLPLQSPVQTPPPLVPNITAATPTLAQVPTVQRVPPTQVLVPTAARTPVFRPTAALVPTAARTPLFLPTPIGGTPDTRATTQAVIATITALAAPPTYPPTATRARPIGAGGRARVTAVPTPTLDPSGISLLSLSNQVFAGGAGALSIRTRAGATCVLQAARAQSDGSSVARPIREGASRQAGDDGVAAWIWSVDKTETPGKIDLAIDCGLAGSARYEIEVAK